MSYATIGPLTCSETGKDGQISVIEAKGKKWGIVEAPLTNTSNIKSIRRVLNVPLAQAKPTGTGKFNDRQ